MKRKVMLVAVAVILCSLVIAGGTLAFTTISGRTTNRVSTGQIVITLVDEYNKQEGLVPNPGKLIEKKVSVESGAQSGDAYVRISLDKAWTTAGAAAEVAYTTDNIVPRINEESWQLLDGYYYYRMPLEQGAKTDLLMDGFYFMPLSETKYEGPLTDNDFKGMEANIFVKAEAVQVANNAVEAVWGVSYDAQKKEFVPAGESVPVESSAESENSVPETPDDNR